MKDFFPSVKIQQQEINLINEIDLLKVTRDKTTNTRVGAITTFLGSVRDLNEGDEVSSMFLEHYPEMTEMSIFKILDSARKRWPIFNARVVHRVGYLKPAENIVFVGVSSSHRKATFEACEFIMDYLKTKAPFWKKEFTSEGKRWLKTRIKDEDQVKEWEKGS